MQKTLFYVISEVLLIISGNTIKNRRFAVTWKRWQWTILSCRTKTILLFWFIASSIHDKTLISKARIQNTPTLIKATGAGSFSLDCIICTNRRQIEANCDLAIHCKACNVFRTVSDSVINGHCLYVLCVCADCFPHNTISFCLCLRVVSWHEWRTFCFIFIHHHRNWRKWRVVLH